MSEAMSPALSLLVDNSKTYIQLSTGALVLTTTFIRDVLGVPRDQPIPRDWFLVASWVLFLLTIVAGSFYQYDVSKWLEGEAVMTLPIPFGVMLACFYLGAISFTAMAVRRIVASKEV